MLTTVVKPGQAQLEFLLLDKKSSRNYANFVGKMSSPAFRPCKYLTLHSFSERIRWDDDNESGPNIEYRFRDSKTVDIFWSRYPRYCMLSVRTNIWVFCNNIYHYTNLCLAFVTQDFSGPFILNLFIKTLEFCKNLFFVCLSLVLTGVMACFIYF